MQPFIIRPKIGVAMDAAIIPPSEKALGIAKIPEPMYPLSKCINVCINVVL